MTKHPYLKCAFSIVLLFSNVCASQDLLKEVRQMRNKLDEIERSLTIQTESQHVNKVYRSKGSKIGAKTSVDKDFVILELSVTEIAPDGLEISAKGSSLEGSIKLASGGIINLKIQDGRYFEMSASQEISKSDEKKGFKSFVATSFVEALSLPELVGNLESSQVSFANGTVQIKLPRLEAKPNLKKLNIVDSESVKNRSIKNID